MLRLEKIEIAQGEFTLAADFEVAPGHSVAVIGPSGAGKSTLLAAIAGFVTPVTGRVLWEGGDITDSPPGSRPISVIFQDNNLFPHLDVARNVALGVTSARTLSSAQQDEVAAALDRVGLDGMGARRPRELSGGQQSRVALARALIRHRPLVLLDEPFAALGPALKDEMLDLVAEVMGEAGATVLMVSHDPEDARRIADQTILVAEGVAHPPVATEPLFADPPPALRAYIG